MSNGMPDISVEAQRLYDELGAAGICVPTRSTVLQYRADLIAAADDQVNSIIDSFDGDIVDLEIAGIACKQLTPAGWSENHDPCIQYAFGGGYVSGSTTEDLVITVPLALHCGARVVMVDYRLSPEHPCPAPQQDMQQVYPVLQEQYGAGRLVVSGESAGGNQALALLQHIKNLGLEMPCCAVLLSPWADLGNHGDSHDFNDARDPTLNNAWVNSATEMHADGHPLDDPGISPIYGDMAGLPACMITTGSRDLLLSQCLRLAQKLRAQDVECDLRVWEGMWHVFEFYSIPEAERSIIEMAQFIRTHSSAAISRLTR